MKCFSLAQVQCTCSPSSHMCGGLVKTAVTWLYHPACGDLVPATGVALRVGDNINQNQLHNSSDSSSAQEYVYLSHKITSSTNACLILPFRDSPGRAYLYISTLKSPLYMTTILSCALCKILSDFFVLVVFVIVHGKI